MPSPNRTSAPAPFSAYPRVAIVTRTPGSSVGHQDRRVLEPEALVEPAQDRVDERFERIGAVDVAGQILERLRREDRVHQRRRVLVEAARGPGARFLGRRFDAQHLVDVRRAKFENPLQAAVRRDRLDSQGHPIEERAGRLGPHEAQPQQPPLTRIRIRDHDQCVRILADVAAALVEELERQAPRACDPRSPRGSSTRRWECRRASR